MRYMRDKDRRIEMNNEMANCYSISFENDF